MIQGYATATSQAALLGPWAWVAFAALGATQLAAMVSQVKSMGSFANGGIITGGKDRKSTRLNSSHANISYAVFCLKKKKYIYINPIITYHYPFLPINTVLSLTFTTCPLISNYESCPHSRSSLSP